MRGGKRAGSDDRNAKGVLGPLSYHESLIPVTAGTAVSGQRRARLILVGCSTHSPRCVQITQGGLGNPQECSTEEENRRNKIGFYERGDPEGAQKRM